MHEQLPEMFASGLRFGFHFLAPGLELVPLFLPLATGFPGRLGVCVFPCDFSILRNSLPSLRGWTYVVGRMTEYSGMAGMSVIRVVWEGGWEQRPQGRAEFR